MNLNFVKSIYHSDVCHFFLGTGISQCIYKHQEKIEQHFFFSILKYAEKNIKIIYLDSTRFYMIKLIKKLFGKRHLNFFHHFK